MMTEDIVLTGTAWARKSKCGIVHQVPNCSQQENKGKWWLGAEVQENVDLVLGVLIFRFFRIE